jgi:putative zinc finger/helix-turn-helix YgiT family protein
MKREQMAYCDNCRKQVPFIVKRETEEVEVRGIKVKVEIDHCFCSCCQEEIDVNFITDANLQRTYDEYKKLKGLLTSKEIKALRQRYGMTAVEFAKAIGAGEKTITRYENGAIQDEVYDKFLRLLDDPVAFAIFSKQNQIFTTTPIKKKKRKERKNLVLLFESPFDVKEWDGLIGSISDWNRASLDKEEQILTDGYSKTATMPYWRA